MATAITIKVSGLGNLIDAYGREADNFIKNMRKQTRKAGTILRKEMKSQARFAFPGGSGRLVKSIRSKRKRAPRGQAIASVGPYGIGLAYGSVLESGGTVERRASKRARAHTATYQRVAFATLALDRSLAKIEQALLETAAIARPGNLIKKTRR